MVLLDEFKGGTADLDLFLQTFDDGRLTDRSGRTTDFRRCIIILTSNVGSAIQAGPPLASQAKRRSSNRVTCTVRSSARSSRSF